VPVAAETGVIARARRSVTLETLVRPYTLLLIGAGLSFLAWVVPWGPSALLEFAHREPLTLGGSLFLLGWYGFFFLVALGGFRLGQHVPPLRRAELVSWESYYVYLSILGAIGTIYSYLYVLAKSPHVIVRALLHQQFNAVRQILPEAAGVQTLRYAATLAAAIAVFELVRRRFHWLHLANVVLLLLTAAVAARVCLIITTIAVVALVARHLAGRRLNLRRVVGAVLLGAVALFLVLAALNYSRNAGYYRAHGVSDPLLMNLDEMVHYLGTPFQASVAVSNHVRDWPAAPGTAASGASSFLLPTYLSSTTTRSVVKAENRYRHLVPSIPQSQTTNSVLAAAYGVFGALAFPILGLVALVAAVVAGHASGYRSYAFLAGPVIAYCFSEWWRVYNFNAGLIQFLVLALAFWALVGKDADRWSRGSWTRVMHLLYRERDRPGSPQVPRTT
jgi:hypothetical protein